MYEFKRQNFNLIFAIKKNGQAQAASITTEGPVQ